MNKSPELMCCAMTPSLCIREPKVERNKVGTTYVYSYDPSKSEDVESAFITVGKVSAHCHCVGSSQRCLVGGHAQCDLTCVILLQATRDASGRWTGIPIGFDSFSKCPCRITEVSRRSAKVHRNTAHELNDLNPSKILLDCRTSGQQTSPSPPAGWRAAASAWIPGVGFFANSASRYFQSRRSERLRVPISERISNNFHRLYAQLECAPSRHTFGPSASGARQ